MSHCCSANRFGIDTGTFDRVTVAGTLTAPTIETNTLNVHTLTTVTVEDLTVRDATVEVNGVAASSAGAGLVVLESGAAKGSIIVNAARTGWSMTSSLDGAKKAHIIPTGDVTLTLSGDAEIDQDLTTTGRSKFAQLDLSAPASTGDKICFWGTFGAPSPHYGIGMGTGGGVMETYVGADTSKHSRGFGSSEAGYTAWEELTASGLAILTTTESTSKSTGAIVVSGGVGIEKNLHMGGQIRFEGNNAALFASDANNCHLSFGAYWNGSNWISTAESGYNSSYMVSKDYNDFMIRSAYVGLGGTIAWETRIGISPSITTLTGPTHQKDGELLILENDSTVGASARLGFKASAAPGRVQAGIEFVNGGPAETGSLHLMCGTSDSSVNVADDTFLKLDQVGGGHISLTKEVFISRVGAMAQDDATLILDRPELGDDANEVGAKLVFRQRWTNAGGAVRVGGVEGVKTVGSGNFGGGLKLMYQPTTDTPLLVAIEYNHDGRVSIPGPLRVDGINEYTTNGGVTIEGVLLKDGQITTAGATEDASVELSNVSLPPSGAPSMELFASTCYIPFFSSSTTNSLYFTIELSESYVAGSDVVPHLHWTTKEPLQTGRQMLWQIEYQWINVDGHYSVTPTTSQKLQTMDSLPAGLATRGHHKMSFPTISGSGLTHSSIMIVHLSRLGGDGSDTEDQEAGAMRFDLHFTTASIGSV